MKVGFTGTRRGMTEAQKDTFYKLITYLVNKEPVGFHHGDCLGADDEAHEIASGYGCAVIIHPSNMPSMTAKNKALFTHPPKDPLVRNHDIVNESDAVFAAPAEFYEQRRSGTWATVRYARHADKCLFIILPNGKVCYEAGRQFLTLHSMGLYEYIKSVIGIEKSIDPR